MCTALSFHGFFGRNLDLDKSYKEEVCVAGRHFPFSFRQMGKYDRHFAIIGMATVAEGMPLYYDAVNEHGVAMAGLHFPHNAHYSAASQGKDNIAPFELIPWVLCQCKNLAEVKALLQNIHLADIPFSPDFPQTPLHWMIATKEGDLVVEATANGVGIFKNTVGVLTNNPPFGDQMAYLEQYKNLQNQSPLSAKNLSPDPRFSSLGLGALGLPGDFSSLSRFVRGAFVRRFATAEGEQTKATEQFFHLLSSVAVPKGCVETHDGKSHYTLYSSAMDLAHGIYYYSTYFHRPITAVSLYHTDIDTPSLHRFPLQTEDSIYHQN